MHSLSLSGELPLTPAKRVNLPGAAQKLTLAVANRKLSPLASSLACCHFSLLPVDILLPTTNLFYILLSDPASLYLRELSISKDPKSFLWWSTNTEDIPE